MALGRGRRWRYRCDRYAFTGKYWLRTPARSKSFSRVFGNLVIVWGNGEWTIVFISVSLSSPTKVLDGCPRYYQLGASGFIVGHVLLVVGTKSTKYTKRFKTKGFVAVTILTDGSYDRPGIGYTDRLYPSCQPSRVAAG